MNIPRLFRRSVLVVAAIATVVYVIFGLLLPLCNAVVAHFC
jgi:hypothetical protein